MAGFKRKVFYIGGFDPRGVRYYYQLMKEQVARWAAHTGEPATVSARRTVSPFRADWTIANPAQNVETDYSFLRWEDLVRRAWIKSPLALGRRMLLTYRDHRRQLDFATLRGMPSGPIKTLLFPPVATLLLPVVIALPLFLLGLIVLPWWVSLIVALALGIAGATPLLQRVHAPWLLRFFVFNGDLAKPGGIPEIDERTDRFVAEIEAALDSGDEDEFLIVTHSNGSILGVSLMAKLLAKRGTMPERFALVTFGHCIPLVACRKDATVFRDQLRTLAGHDFRWFDIGSPPDGAAYSFVDPMKLVGPETNPRLQMLSPRFYRFYSPETYHQGLSHKYAIHFDYLRTGDTISPIDFPSLLASARSIERSIAEFRKVG